MRSTTNVYNNLLCGKLLGKGRIDWNSDSSLSFH